MNFYPAGALANKYWQEIPDHFPHVQLKEYVIMPNHVHGIVVIGKYGDNDCTDVACTDVACNVSTEMN
jgi:hypothetical protein